MDMLRKLFTQYSYTTEKQQISLIKILAISGALDEPEKEYNGSENRHYTVAHPIWLKSGLENKYQKFSLISSKKASSILDESYFDSLYQASQWFIGVTQARWPRASAGKEGLHNTNTSINTERWKQQDPEKYVFNREKILHELGILNKINARNLNSFSNIKHIIVQGGLEKEAALRFPELRDFPEEINIYYATGIRALQHNEPSCARVLALWLNMPDKEGEIKEILYQCNEPWLDEKVAESLEQKFIEHFNLKAWPGRPHDKEYITNVDIFRGINVIDFSKNIAIWLAVPEKYSDIEQALTQFVSDKLIPSSVSRGAKWQEKIKEVKEHILQVTGLSNWPELTEFQEWEFSVGPYIENDYAAKAKLVTHWPVAADMLDLWIQDAKNKYPELSKTSIRLFNVVSSPYPGGQLADTARTIQAFHYLYGQKLLIENEKLTLGNVSSQPFVDYQEQTMLNQLPKSYSLATFGGALAKDTAICHILDVFMREFYARRQRVEPTLKKLDEIAESSFERKQSCGY